MGICDSEENFPHGESFKKGEQYFFQVCDSNIEGKDSSNNQDKIDLYFSLVEVKNPTLMHSFSITIINNAILNIETYLGDLEERKGKEIKYGNSFEVSYFFQREQILIIQPKINGVLIGIKKKITLSQLILCSNNTNIIFEGIGKLIIQFQQRKRGNDLDNNLIGSFQFKFNLSNKIFYNDKNLAQAFFVLFISDSSDNQSKRALYKSQEFYNINIMSNIIDIPTKLLMFNGNPSSLLHIAFYCPNIRNKRPVGYSKFNLAQVEYDSNRDINTNIVLESPKYNYIGNININYNKKERLTFIDYLAKGMQINLDIAIDYTYSNNDPENPVPLHNSDPRYPNDYEKAIESCGSIVAFYDYDKLFPVYGFGGIPRFPNRSNNSVSHCFNINFKNDPNIEGINNIILAYRESLSKVELASPTFFSYVIDKVIKEVKYDMQHNRQENHYYILLILTDGCVNDMEQTRNKIVEASYLPMSIIIVGIGKADFTLMDMLDGDAEQVVNSNGQPWKRDIVQFVEFSKFKEHDKVNYGTDLTEEVLKEIPKQVEEYYQKVGQFYEW